MNENKQIEEMAKLIHLNYDCSLEFAEDLSEFLYDEGYHQQSEGEWISVEGDVIFKCSICDAEISTSWDYENDDMWGFCPCCGANMKKE